MRTDYYDKEKYYYKKDRQYIAEYEIVEADSISDLKRSVAKKVNEGFDIEGGMVVYGVEKYDVYREQFATTNKFAQTMVHYVIKIKEVNADESATTIDLRG